jgi:retron-type reverse transcriptase
VVEFDIKAAFDQIDHGLLMKAVGSHIKESWIRLYIERWLKAPFETADGERLERERGTPQGGVVSPILMNLFMHYAFDAWMQRMRGVIRGWRIHRQTSATLAELAKQCNPAIRGWWNYFGAFYRTAMRKLTGYIDQRLEQWARRKYKTLTRHTRRSAVWLRRMKHASPGLFYHWRVAGERVG